MSVRPFQPCLAPQWPSCPNSSCESSHRCQVPCLLPPWAAPLRAGPQRASTLSRSQPRTWLVLQSHGSLSALCSDAGHLCPPPCSSLSCGAPTTCLTSHMVVSSVSLCPLLQEMQPGSLGREDPLEEGMTTHSRILAWRIPWRLARIPWRQGHKELDSTE